MPLPKISKKPYLNKPNLKDLDLPEIETCIAPLGKETYRARQIMKWLYQHGAESFEEMTNLSKAFRAALNDIARIGQPDIAKTQTSADEDPVQARGRPFHRKRSHPREKPLDGLCFHAGGMPDGMHLLSHGKAGL
jgi:hypothetical protein